MLGHIMYIIIKNKSLGIYTEPKAFIFLTFRYINFFMYYIFQMHSLLFLLMFYVVHHPM